MLCWIEHPERDPIVFLIRLMDAYNTILHNNIVLYNNEYCYIKLIKTNSTNVLKIITSKLQRAGEMVAIMEVFVLPPRESCNSLVSLLSLLKKQKFKILPQDTCMIT